MRSLKYIVFGLFGMVLTVCGAEDEVSEPTQGAGTVVIWNHCPNSYFTLDFDGVTASILAAKSKINIQRPWQPLAAKPKMKKVLPLEFGQVLGKEGSSFVLTIAYKKRLKGSVTVDFPMDGKLSKLKPNFGAAIGSPVLVTINYVARKSPKDSEWEIHLHLADTMLGAG